MTGVAAVARKDWREFIRDRRLLVMTVFVLLLALVAVVTAYARVAGYEADRVATEQRDRVTWESQGERNPHSAAHFATWALRPLTPLAVLEPGVTPYAGSAIWMEAHYRNGARARPVDDAAIAFDVGTFSVTWVLQTLVPLLLFVVAASLVARERERGTLRLLLVGGADARGLLPGKLVSLGGIALLLTLPVLVAGVLAALLAGPADLLRLGLWTLVYLVFLGIVAGFAVSVSALARTVSGAMLVLVGLWCVAVLMAPRAGAALAQATAPTPSAEAFWGGMRDDMAEVVNPFSDDSFREAVLALYSVETVEELPVDFGGLALHESEERSAVVFERHFGELAATYARQRSAMRWASVVSPLPALQNLSTAIAGTDGLRQMAFADQAEAHRFRMVAALNRDLIDHGVQGGWDYTAGPELWRETEAFEYRQPPLAESARSVGPDLVILGLWALAAILAVRLSARRLARRIL